MDEWSDKTDFSQVESIGYLCDNQEVAQAECLREGIGKIFVHFEGDAGHFGKQYAWLEVPNHRICAPPKKRARRIPFHVIGPPENHYDRNDSNIDNSNDSGIDDGNASNILDRSPHYPSLPQGWALPGTDQPAFDPNLDWNECMERSTIQ